MCGIAGVYRLSGPAPEGRLLREMISKVAYRGPDESDVLIRDQVGLAHARLSIIDVEGGQQPMVDPDSGAVIVFNGEIFNYVELRSDLESRGHRFVTRSDTEVILHMYAEFGESCVQSFNGQWAFAIWDPGNMKLFLSRDRLGILPLHWTRVGDEFIFGSEVKSLLAHPRVEPRVDLEAMDDIFTLWVTVPPRTFFKDVWELPPGHSLVISSAGVRESCHWRLDYPEPDDGRTESDLIEELTALLADSVRLRLRSDVPVGAYLSGGLDSSLTVAMIKRFTDTPLETFSVTFSDAEYDESEFQQAVVRLNHTKHTSIACGGAEIGEAFPKVVFHAEKPILRTAPAPLYLLSKLVRECGYKVVLTGEGADEVFGGYDIFKEAKIRRFWSAFPESTFRPLLLKRLYPYMPGIQAQSTEYLKAFFHVGFGDVDSPFFSHLPRWELTSKLKGFFSADVKGSLKGRNAQNGVSARLPEGFAGWDSFCQAQYLEAAYLLPGYILSSQGDRMLMANSVEGRFPFLDHRVVEFAAKLHPRHKMRVLDEKYLLKQMARDMVPAQVAKRPKQPYRAPDVPSFFCGGTDGVCLEYVTEALSAEAIADGGVFDPRAVQGLLRKCQGGRASGVKDSMALVGVLSTQLAIKQFVKNRGVV